MMNDIDNKVVEKDGIYSDGLPPPASVDSSVDGIILKDDSVDEEAPSMDQDHDQLPSPEEYKAKMRDSGGVGRVSSTSTESKSRSRLLVCLGLFLLIAIITAIAVPLALKNKNGIDLTESQLNTGFVDEGDGKLTMYYDDDDALDDDEVTVAYTPPVSFPVPRPVSSPVASPVSSPIPINSSSNDRMEQTISYLVSSGVAKADLDNKSSPQSKASNWIANNDEFEMDIPSPSSNIARTRFIERWTLAVLYYSTSGSNWKHNLKFLEPIDHCDWAETFITTSGSLIRMGVTSCEEQGPGYGDREDDEMVSKIDLSNNGLSGSLPTEMQYFRKLEELIVPHNANLVDNESLINLTSLSALKHLELQYCGISGRIPDDIGSLGALTFLGLGNNLLTGTIPDSFFNLSSLNFLGLDDNALESPISPFVKFTNIEKLYIEDNLISGELTEDMINGWQKMIDLDVSANKLDGPLPSNIWSMPNLEVLDFHGNKFVGMIPEIESAHEKIRFVALHNNAFDWRVPESISNLVNLEHLDISFNNLALPFPSSMNQLSNLRSLYTGANNFNEHPIPSFLEDMTNLREISMKQNKLTGTIPTFVDRLTNLKVLDLDFNQLKGSIPSELGRLTNINTLMLNRNELTGTIPDSFSSMEKIDLLLLDGNNLSGTADVICNEPSIDTTFFSADCADPNPEIECTCCHLCCNDNDPSCNNFDWNINLDGIWEYDFKRVAYKFSQNILAEQP